MKFPQFSLVLLSIFLLISLNLPATNAADVLYIFCGTTGNFTANSTYDSNLQTLLTNLATDAANSTSNSGFAKNTVGSVPNQISGLVLCRGDVNSTVCYSCLSQASQDIQNLCPYNKEATIYYDFCLLRFSNQNFLTSATNSQQIIMFNVNNATEPQTFDSYVNYLMNNTADYAAFNNSKKFGTAQLNKSKVFDEIYGLAQCTPDLSNSECLSCLNGLTGEMSNYLNGRIGGRILGLRCNIRYEIYVFYSGVPLLFLAPPTKNASAPTPAPAPAPVAAPVQDNVTSPPSINPAPHGLKTSIVTLAITIPLVLAFVAILGLSVCFIKRRKSELTKILQIDDPDPEEIKSVESLVFDLSVLKDATAKFSKENKLGEGGFGAVYKGVLPNGRDIAVKRLSENSNQGLDELKNELLLVAKLQHRNLVRVLGVCLEGEEKLLVYEFLPNRSLDLILADTDKRSLLDWGKRQNIICGIARGLLYLHEDSQITIIHRDLKASNVLLDAEMNPKISDFGLARLFAGDQTHQVTNRVVGTFGYMAPEYAIFGQFSMKSDVFSYGVLVLEIITGKKNSGTSETEDLLSFVWKHWINGTINEVADSTLGQNYPKSELLRCTQIALLCVQDNPADRPTMSKVAVMLSSETVSLENPSRPAFCIAKSGIYSSSSYEFNDVGGTTDWPSSKSIQIPPNKASVTDIAPR